MSLEQVTWPFGLDLFICKMGRMCLPRRMAMIIAGKVM